MLDVRFRDRRDAESATAFFHRALGTAGQAPTIVVRDHHQPYVAAVQEVLPGAARIRTGVHRAAGETTRCGARSHGPTRDRLRASRGLKTLATGQRCSEGFEALHALQRGRVHVERSVPGSPPAGASPRGRARAVVSAPHARGARRTRAA